MNHEGHEEHEGFLRALRGEPFFLGLLLDAIRYRQQHLGWRVYGWVVLENHMQMIVHTSRLQPELAAFKSYTARCLIDYLTEHRVRRILDQLKRFKKRHKTDRTYQLWEEGSHPQLLQSEDVLQQKLDYIHRNPVKRGYVDLPEHWRYSSARIYWGQPGLLEIDTRWWTG